MERATEIDSIGCEWWYCKTCGQGLRVHYDVAATRSVASYRRHLLAYDEWYTLKKSQTRIHAVPLPTINDANSRCFDAQHILSFSFGIFFSQ